jgi:beta-N-acetylhexosaminidase
MLAEMTLAEKVGQLFIIAAEGQTMTPNLATLLAELRPGGVIFLGPNIGSPDQIRSYTRAIHRSDAGLPPLIAVDQEGGPVTRVPGDPAPGAVELGREPGREVRIKARQRAQFLLRYGFDVNFAPVADVAYQPTSMMAWRSFGSDPSRVALRVNDFVRGSRTGGMLGAAKHFPGHGRTPVDSHYAIPEIDIPKREWLHSDGLPFQAAVKAGVEMVMLGHLRFPQWDSAPASLSRTAVRTLRHDLGFRGIIVTDDLGMGALRGMDPFEAVDRALRAGVDLLLYASYPAPIRDLVDHLRHQVKRGKITEARIDASVRRILRLKILHFGLLERSLRRSSEPAKSGVKG